MPPRPRTGVPPSPDCEIPGSWTVQPRPLSLTRLQHTITARCPARSEHIIWNKPYNLGVRGYRLRSVPREDTTGPPDHRYQHTRSHRCNDTRLPPPGTDALVRRGTRQPGTTTRPGGTASAQQQPAYPPRDSAKSDDGVVRPSKALLATQF